jgi:hypothetical protein
MERVQAEARLLEMRERSVDVTPGAVSTRSARSGSDGKDGQPSAFLDL